MFCGITYILKVENSLMREIAILYASTFRQQRMIRFHCSVEVRTGTVCILCCHPPSTPTPAKKKKKARNVHIMSKCLPGEQRSQKA